MFLVRCCKPYTTNYYFQSIVRSTTLVSTAKFFKLSSRANSCRGFLVGLLIGTCLEVMWSIQPWCHTAETGVLSFVPKQLWICLTNDVHWWTELKSESPEDIWVTMSIILSFFYHLKVIKTQPAYSSLKSLFFNSFPFLKKWMFCNCKTSICLLSNWGFCRYLQKQYTKKKALMAIWLIACSTSVIFWYAISLGTPICRAFCWTGFGSLFLKAQYFQDKCWLSLLPLSQVGFGLSCSWKVDATNEMVFWFVLSARESWIGPENHLECRAMAKAPKSLFFTPFKSIENDVINNSNVSAEADPSWPCRTSCVFHLTSPSLAAFAAARSAKRWLHLGVDKLQDNYQKTMDAFFVAGVIVPREKVWDLIVVPWESLRVFLTMMSCNIPADSWQPFPLGLCIFHPWNWFCRSRPPKFIYQSWPASSYLLSALCQWSQSTVQL